MEARKLEEFARFYHNLGFNFTQINGEATDHISKEDLSKTPISELWKYFTIKRMDNFEQWWDKYAEITGIGTILGPNLRCIDIDDCDDDNFIEEILNILYLPSNYEWVVRTGSKKGYHIIFECESHNFPVAWGKVKAFASNGSKNFKRLELRWFGHLVLPPSLHKSGGKYEFLSGKLPNKPPRKINEEKIEFIIKEYCADRPISGKSGIFLDHGPSYISEEISVINDDLFSFYKDPLKLIFAIKYNEFDKIIMAISWVLYDNSGRIIEYCNYLINPQELNSIWIPGYYDLSLESNITSTTDYGVSVHQVLIALRNRMEICDEFYILDNIEDSKILYVFVKEGDPVTLEEYVRYYYKELGLGLNKKLFSKYRDIENLVESGIPRKILFFSRSEPLNSTFTKIINFIKAIY